MEQYFRLYTWQNPDWDITKETRDSSMGTQRWDKDTWSGLQLLYKELEKKTNTLDFLWCFTEYEHWMQHDISRLWVLNVPSSKIVHILDSKIWSTMVQAVSDNKPLKYTYWNNLILEKSIGIKKLSAGNNDITPLIHVPLCSSIQVIDKSKFNKGIKHSNARYKDLPTSKCDAKKYRN